jgi:hypothetical protein
MKLIISILIIFTFKATFGQYKPTIEKDPVTGYITTTVYTESKWQKFKSRIYSPHYYTKRITVKDSTGRLKWRIKMKRYSFGCDRDIGDNYKLVLYKPEDTRTIIKFIWYNVYSLKVKKNWRLIWLKHIDNKKKNALLEEEMR